MVANQHPRAGVQVEDLATKGKLCGRGHDAGNGFLVVEEGLDSLDNLVVCSCLTYLLPVAQLVTINCVVATQNSWNAMD